MTALKVDLVASMPHYRSHLQPIWDALPDDARGEIRVGIDAGHTPSRNHVCMVASWRDMSPLRGLTQFIYVEHGAGQNYAGDPKSAHWADYAGPGRVRHMDVLAYICPSQRVAKLWQHSHAFAVGCPRLDDYIVHPLKELKAKVCLTFHWPCKVAPEADSAFKHYAAALPAIVAGFNEQGWAVRSHVHPKWEGEIDSVLEAAGAPLITNTEALSCQVMIADNTSSMYEAAALGRHVIALNAPWYRRDVNHGLRFWEAIPGLQIDEPIELERLELDEVVNSKWSAYLRDEAVAYAYAHADGKSAQRAADAIMAVLD